MPTYHIVVDGPDSLGMEGRFPTLAVARTAEAAAGQTVLQGDLPDQSALLGVLQYLDMLGVGIRRAERLPED